MRPEKVILYLIIFASFVSCSPSELDVTYSSNTPNNSSDITAPAVPSGLSATTLPGQVTLSWNSVSGADSYTVHRGTTSGSYTQLATNITSPLYLDTTAINGTTYYYAITSYNGKASAKSGPVSIRPIAAFTLSQSSVTATTVQLDWNTAAGASRYDLKYGTTSGVYLWSLDDVTSPMTLDGLSSSTTYYLKIEASNTIGPGSSFSSDEIAITMGDPPSQVINLTAKSHSSHIELNWDSATGAMGYRVYRNFDGDSPTEIIDTTGTSFNDVAPEDGIYFYHVVSYSGGIEAAQSDFAKAARPKVISVQNPVGVWAADINNDGYIRPDLVVASGNEQKIRTYFFNPATLDFDPPAEYDTPSGIIYSIFISDLDNDGILDLLCASKESGEVGVMLNDGSGSLSAIVNYTASINNTSLFAADLDGDSFADLIFSDTLDPDLSFIPNDTSGNFAGAPLEHAVPTPLLYTISADLDNDGWMDVIATDENNKLQVFMNGLGTLSAPQEWDTQLRPIKIHSVDLNGDSFLDLVVLNHDSSSFTVFINDGGGGFSAINHYPLNDKPISITSGDFYAVGTSALVIGLENDSGFVIVQGDGAGSFDPDPANWEYYITEQTVNDLFAADMNGDGLLDLIVAEASINEVRIFYFLPF